jgi:hypothetical protein
MLSKGWTSEKAFDFVRGLRNVAKMRRFGGMMPQWRAIIEWENSIWNFRNVRN